MATASPDVSIIVATRNSWTDLKACLPSIAGSGTDRYELVAVDNGSTDGTVSRLQMAYPGATVIANASNLGHCRAINQGLRAASGTFVVVLDADTIFWPGALDRLVTFLRRHPEAAIVAPRMLNADGSVQETARTFPRPINALFGRQTILTRLLPRNRFSIEYLRRANLDTSQPFVVDWVSAACMVFRRSLVEQIGFWDEGFGGYWVDADWCRRAHATGHIVCEPAARVTHAEQNRSGRKKSAARIVQFHAGANRLYRKHYTWGFWDPRALATCGLLAGRAAVLVLANALRRADAAPPEFVPIRHPEPLNPSAGETGASHR